MLLRKIVISKIKRLKCKHYWSKWQIYNNNINHNNYWSRLDQKNRNNSNKSKHTTFNTNKYKQFQLQPQSKNITISRIEDEVKYLFRRLQSKLKINEHDLKRLKCCKFENEMNAMNNNNKRTIKNNGILEIQI